MTRKSKNLSVKKFIYVFWEGESEKAYLRFLKDEFERCAVIKSHRESGTFITANACCRNDKIFKSSFDEISELWFFFDTEIEKGNQWDYNIRIIDNIVRKHSARNPVKVRLLMTSCCLEYWLLLHYEKTAPAIATPADKERLLAELVRKYEHNYKKGDYASTANIAKNYKTAVQNGKWTLAQLESEGLPENETLRNKWLFSGVHTFTTVHEAILFLMDLSENFH